MTYQSFKAVQTNDYHWIELFRLEYLEKNINTRLMKEWTAIDKLSIIWKSDGGVLVV